MTIEWTRDRIITLPTSELRAIVASTHPATRWAAHVEWARQELARRENPPSK